MNTKTLPLRLGAALLMLLTVVTLALSAAGTDGTMSAGGDANRCRPEVTDCVDTTGDTMPDQGIAVGEPNPNAPGGVEVPGIGMCARDLPECNDTDLGIAWAPIDIAHAVEGDATTPSGELVDAVGSDVTVGFWMGIESCYAVNAVDVTETDTTVSVDISVVGRPGVDTCIAIAEARSVTVTLAAPLGDRNLVVGGEPAGR